MHISFKTKTINKQYTTAVAATFVFIIFHIIISSECNAPTPNNN